ncbi:NADH-quinone oxidoreductase subunit J [Egibacter rhizosphaerae]|uniref:NADH-quinone oxidoreductase subunit J n=1 Tax=Egibacter rhizosphaerae TaxID=1670831 RepID=A0A411YGS8_9ACTN|nr:NADH-quinone oxidoreductase subunit J [Egibacter rhizosphaerae]QBI20366.1 NADH-quinone oxidoreductase subunit J [Egibacter rhizosphaerae]
MTPVLAQAAEAAQASGSAELYAFVIIGALSLGSAIAMVMMRNAVHSALMLVLNLFTIAAFYAMLEAQFLAVIQIIVYAGAIVVLFLFVIMLLGVGGGQAFTGRLRGQKVAAVLLGLALFSVLAGITGPYWGEAAACNLPFEVRAEGDGLLCEGLAEANAEGNVRGVGLLIFTDYVWPFEVMSVLLVIAALGAMVLGKRYEDPADVVDQPAAAVPATRGPSTAGTASASAAGSAADEPGARAEDASPPDTDDEDDVRGEGR